MAGQGPGSSSPAWRATPCKRRPPKCKRPAATLLGIQADITQQADVDRLFAEAIRHYGKLDVLVNNAGRSMRGKVLDTTPEQFRDLMELNLIALVRCTRAAAPHLLETRGHVVNIGSLAAKSASRWVGAYPATKHAVAAYSQQLRLELGPQGLHVLLVCPGPIERKDPRLYPLEGLEDMPERARQPGAGVKTKAVAPQWLAAADLAGLRAPRGRISWFPAQRGCCLRSSNSGRAWAIGSC